LNWRKLVAAREPVGRVIEQRRPKNLLTDLEHGPQELARVVGLQPHRSREQLAQRTAGDLPALCQPLPLGATLHTLGRLLPGLCGLRLRRDQPAPLGFRRPQACSQSVRQQPLRDGISDVPDLGLRRATPARVS
jgi:hypothetical protein